MDSLKKANAGVVAIGSILLAIFIFWAGSRLASFLASSSSPLINIGSAATSTPINAPTWMASFLDVVLGISSGTATWEGLIIRLAIFIIIVFAMADLIEMFSSFTTTTSWIIALGLGMIAGVSKAIAFIAGLMAVTAQIGAIGIMIIILSAIIAAVTLNLGLGGVARKWRLQRQVEMAQTKSSMGAGEVTGAIKGLKEVNTAFKAGNL